MRAATGEAAGRRGGGDGGKGKDQKAHKPHTGYLSIGYSRFKGIAVHGDMHARTKTSENLALLNILDSLGPSIQAPRRNTHFCQSTVGLRSVVCQF